MELIQDIQPIPRNDQCYGNVLQRGDLSTLSWLHGPVDTRKEVDVVNVQYSSINFRDVMLVILIEIASVTNIFYTNNIYVLYRLGLQQVDCRLK